MITIYTRHNSLLYQSEKETKDEAVEEAVAAGVDLSEAQLSGENLEGAKLKGGKFSGADFSNTCLAGADLRGADFTHANFYFANLYAAKLDRAKFNHACLALANFDDNEGWHTADFKAAHYGHLDHHCQFCRQLDDMIKQVNQKYQT